MDEFELPDNCSTKTVDDGVFYRVNGAWVDESGKPESEPKQPAPETKSAPKKK